MNNGAYMMMISKNSFFIGLILNPYPFGEGER